MKDSTITLESASPTQRQVIENMYPLFIHDQWAYSDSLPNQFGIIESALNSSGTPASTLSEQSEQLAPYWTEAHHHPFLIQVDEKPAGFCLVQSAPLAPDRRDFYLDEFFILHPYRRMRVGRRVFQNLVSTRPGQWVVDMKARNEPAREFWLTVTTEISREKVAVIETHNEYGPTIRIEFVV